MKIKKLHLLPSVLLASVLLPLGLQGCEPPVSTAERKPQYEGGAQREQGGHSERGSQRRSAASKGSAERGGSKRPKKPRVVAKKPEPVSKPSKTAPRPAIGEAIASSLLEEVNELLEAEEAEALTQQRDRQAASSSERLALYTRGDDEED